MKPRLLLDDLKPGVDEGKVSWYPEPHVIVHKPDEAGYVEIKGTFRSADCSRSGDSGAFEDEMCASCTNIPKLKSFKKRLMRRSEKTDEERDTLRIRNDYLSAEEMKQKLNDQKQKLDMKDSKIFFMSAKNIRLRIRARTIREKLAEFARRGSMKAVCYNLQKAADNGLLEDRNTLKGLLETVSKNFHVEKNGKRYQAPFKLFLEVLLLWGGPRIANFVAINLGGPEIHSIYRWRNQHRTELDGGIKETNFKQLSVLYKEAMATGKVGPVPVLAAEDETGIIGQISYNQRTDELLGFCGVKGTEHKCLDYFTVSVGEGEEGYKSIVNAFEQCKIGTYGRAILLNPLHPKLPRIAVLTMPTCNKFDHTFVYRQWQDVERLYEQELKPIMGPLIGHSSDGDSRRRKIMLQLATVTAGSRFQPIPRNEGFVFSCRKEGRGNDYVIHDMCDQDFIHNHKKLLNPLDHANRVLMMGNFLVHMNHIQLVYESCPVLDHGLGLGDIDRRDRQNWRSAQKLTFPKVRQCIQTLIDGTLPGTRPNAALLGTQTYLQVVWYYVEIFCSEEASLSTRIKYAAIVTHFLAIWRNSVYRDDHLKLATNFITRVRTVLLYDP